MKIEIWSDFVCPYCFVGKTNLEIALRNQSPDLYVNIEYRSYPLLDDDLLDSDMYRQQMERDVLKESQQIGITLRRNRILQENTYDAHRLVNLAKKYHKEKELIDRLFTASLIEDKSVDNPEVLYQLTEQTQLRRDEVTQVLNMNTYHRKVSIDKMEAKEIGVNCLPFFVFNETHAVAGLQHVDVFKEVIKVVWQEEQKNPELRKRFSTKAKTSYCTGEACDNEKVE